MIWGENRPEEKDKVVASGRGKKHLPEDKFFDEDPTPKAMKLFFNQALKTETSQGR